MPLVTDGPSLIDMGERELRRQIDRSVTRAMVDHDYAQHLLADPTVAIDQRGCTPQQYLALRGIRASSVSEFAQQAMARFWFEPAPRYRPAERMPLPAAAGS